MGTGTNTLVFQYTIAQGDTDTDGVSIAADQLSLNGGTITDTVGNAAVLTHAGLTTQPTHKVDTLVPVLNRVAITSTPTNTIAYKEGENIQITATFSENVIVTGTPQVTLTIGTADKQASWMRGTDTTNLVFEYTVTAGDTDTDGVSIAANQLFLNGGTITDAAGNAATLTHAALSTQTNHKVDAIAPSINGIALTSTPNNTIAYKKDESIQITATFTENVTVTGTPQVTLTIGTADKQASWMRGTDTTHLVFEYTVTAGDTDTDGVSIACESALPQRWHDHRCHR